MSFTPSQERALKLIEDFETGPKLSDMRLKSSARMSGAFPLPIEITKANPMTPFSLNKRPFDDTILNQNDSLLKKRRVERRRSNDDSNDSFNDSIAMASPWEMRKIKGDLIQAKAEIITLEARCNQLFNLRKEDLLLYDQEKKSFKQTIENNRQTISEFEAKLKKMRKKEQQMREELDRKHELKIQDFNLLEEKTNALLEENRNLKTKISEMELKHGETTRDFNTAKLELNSAIEKFKLTSEQMSKLQAQLAELKVTARQHELDKALLLIAQRKVAELESEASSYSETATMMKEQQSKLIRMSEMERQLTLLKKENINLRDAPNRIMKLNEVIHDLTERLSNLEQTDAVIRSVKMELGLAMNELNEYRTLTKGIMGEAAGHLELTKYIREMRQSSVLAHSDIGCLQAKLKAAEDGNQVISTSCSNLQAEVTKLKSELEITVSTVRRLKKQHAIITRERDDLRKMLDSLQKETTVACVDSKVEALEQLVEGYRQRFNQIEQDMVGNLLAPTSSQSDNSATLENLRKKNAELMQRIEKLEYELDHRNLKGDFDTRNTKILHFEMNPTAVALNEREDALEKAKSEIEMLRQKVKILKNVQNTSQCVNVTQIAADNIQVSHSKELDELREKVKSQELQNQRLMEAFKMTSREFREAIHTLLGYNVSAGQNKKLFKLTSMYSDSPDQHLLFQMLPEGGMELLETDLSKSAIDLIELHLCQNHSIPMFLSALTMQLFNLNSQSSIIG